LLLIRETEIGAAILDSGCANWRLAICFRASL
jgi:hypothetical protein